MAISLSSHPNRIPLPLPLSLASTSTAAQARSCSDAAPCFGKAFGYFGTCDADVVYAHGYEFLEDVSRLLFFYFVFPYLPTYLSSPASRPHAYDDARVSDRKTCSVWKYMFP